ncbi:protein bicaudal D2-like [Arapaima gigas]
MSEADLLWLRSEVERLSQELSLTSREKEQAAEYGLAVLEDKQRLQLRFEQLEVECDSLRHELEHLRQALGHAHSSHKKVAADGESREDSLLQESASQQAFYKQRQLDLQAEVKKLRNALCIAQAENERLATTTINIQESHEAAELQQCRLRDDIKEYKVRESRLLQDCTELEEENISLQKQVSALKQSQVEFEGLKHEVRRLEEELQFRNSQLEGTVQLKVIAERQLGEALETIKSEREQKAALRKELNQHLSAGYLFPLATPQDSVIPSSEESLTDSSGDLSMLANGTKSPPTESELCQPTPSLVDELLSELKMSEIQKLKQQLLQVEREKGALLASLQDSQAQLESSQEALAKHQEQQDHSATRKLQASKGQHQTPPSTEGNDGDQEDHDYELDANGPEILACRYKLAVAKAAELRNELTDLQADHQEQRTQLEQDRDRLQGELQELSIRLLDLEDSSHSGREEVLRLQGELKRVGEEAAKWKGALALIQDEMAAFSEELASLYHHVCMCNNETPSRVTLDFFRKGGVTEPADVHSLAAVVREQLAHLHRAVEHTVEVSCQQGAELKTWLPEQEAYMLENLKLKSLLSTKREQIATLRAVLKVNKQTAEVALANLKSRYESEKAMVTETLTKLSNDLKGLKEDAATFSSLRSMFATRCDEYVMQLDEMQRQLMAAEDERKTLNSLLRMAIQQKLALTQRLEDLEFQREESSRQRLGGRGQPSFLLPQVYHTKAWKE